METVKPVYISEYVGLDLYTLKEIVQFQSGFNT